MGRPDPTGGRTTSRSRASGSSRDLIGALASIKGAASGVNKRLGVFDGDLADAIHDAAAAVSRGKYDDQFPIDVFQNGLGYVVEHEHERGDRVDRDGANSAGRCIRTIT